jgi:hypothetical protein
VKRKGATMKLKSKATAFNRVMPAVTLSELCSEAADHVARARTALFDESYDADAALLHLDEAIFCLKRLLARGRSGMNGSRLQSA